MLCEPCQNALLASRNGFESKSKLLHAKCRVIITINEKRKRCECICNSTIPIVETIKGPTLNDINPKSWLSKYNSTYVEHLITMGIFYYVLGLFVSVLITGIQLHYFGYDERYPPRSLVFAFEASPLEETAFYGIPYYASGNQYVVMATGVASVLFHLGNTQPENLSLYNLAYGNLAFSIFPFFFAYRTWTSGKGWFSILFHFGWDSSIISLLMLFGHNPWLVFSNDSYRYIELALLGIIPGLLTITYFLYKRRQKTSVKMPKNR